jgi:hypothetical protein
MTQYEKDINWAASQFLYDDLPDGYQDWPNKKLYEFLRMYAWKPFEHYSGEWLWAHIQDLAVSMRKYAEENK